MTPEQLEAVNDSDALCPCGANPREATNLEGWFVDTVLVWSTTSKGYAREVRIACPECW